MASDWMLGVGGGGGGGGGVGVGGVGGVGGGSSLHKASYFLNAKCNMGY